MPDIEDIASEATGADKGNTSAWFPCCSCLAGCLSLPVMILLFVIALTLGGSSDAPCSGSGTMGNVLCPDGTISEVAEHQASIIPQINQNLSTYLAASQKFGTPWELIAALHYRETNLATSGQRGQGGSGPMQFIDATWAQYGADGNGDGRKDILNFEDSVFASANYLNKLRGDRFSSGTYTEEDIALASLYYNRGSGSNYGKNYDNHPYTMNNADAAHRNMRWPSSDGYISGQDSRDGVLAIYRLLVHAEKNPDGTIIAVGDCNPVSQLDPASGSSDGASSVPFATQMPLQLINTNTNYGQPTHIVLHYTASEQNAEGIHQYFQNLLNDSDQGNNKYVQFFIDKKGGIYQFTPVNKQVAGAQGFNATGPGQVSISIENQGHFESNDSSRHETPAQVEANVRLVKYLMEQYNIPKQNVISHGEAWALGGNKGEARSDPGERFMKKILIGL